MMLRRLLLAMTLLAAPAFAQSPADAPVPEVKVGRIERLANLASKHVDPRHVDVWLPDGYTPAKRYAVLYMQDGQMLFDATKAWNKQAWNVHEAVTRLSRAGLIRDVIVVGIWNNGVDRYAEYYPEKALAFAPEKVRREYVEVASNGRSKADAYLRFMVEELKPEIDRRYATRPGRESTFVLGSSMGGLISLYALCEYPQVFGGAAALSTHWVGRPTAWGRERVRNAALPLAAMTYLSEKLPEPQGHRVYTDRGDDWLDSLYEPGHRMVEEVLRDRGYTGASAMTAIFHGTGHNEADWAQRVETPLTFLLRP